MDMAALKSGLDDLLARLPSSLRDLDARVWSLAAGASGALVLYWWRSRSPHRNMPPGPRPWPLVGNLLQLRGQTYEWCLEQSKKYGPVMMVYFGSLKTVVINSTKLAHEAFVDKAEHFSGRPQTYTLDIWSDHGKSIMFGQYTPVWRLQRKLAHSAIRNYASGETLNARIQECVDGVAERFVRVAGRPVDIRDDLSLMVYNNTCGGTFGKTFEMDDPEFQAAYKSQMDILEVTSGGLMAADLFPVLQYLPALPQERAVRRIFNSFYIICLNAWRSHKESFDSNNLRDVTDHVLDAWYRERDDPSLGQLTETHFVLILLDMFGAGVDTTFHTLYWFFHYMVVHPHVQAKCQEEIDRVTGGRAPDMRDRQKLPYLEAAVMEALYHSGFLGLGLPHRVDGECKLGGYDIPDGALVVVNYYALPRGHDVWTPDYTPERHLSAADGQLTSRPPGFYPFSLGKRACVGEALGKTTMVLFTAKLLHRFSFSAADEASRDLSADPKIGVTAVSRRYRVIVKDRHA